MNRVKLAALAALVALVAAAVGATAAQATEGPFWVIEGKGRLLAGEKHPIGCKLAKEFVLKSNIAIEIKSKKIRCYEPQSFLLGSTGPNGGSSEEEILFEENTVVGNGTGCTIGSIHTKAVNNFLDYENNKRTGKILILFKPVKGSIFAELTFTGENCKFKTTAVEGSVDAEAWSGGKPVEIGTEPAPTATGEVNFPAVAIKTAFKEKEGALTENKAGLTAFGVASTLVGRGTVELKEHNWCISTGIAGTNCK